MLYKHNNSGIEKDLHEEKLVVTIPCISFEGASALALNLRGDLVTCLLHRSSRTLSLTFFTVGTSQPLATYTLLFASDPSGTVWESVVQTILDNSGKAEQNPLWRHPTKPEGETWLAGTSFSEIDRITEPYAIAICRAFLAQFSKTRAIPR